MVAIKEFLLGGQSREADWGSWTGRLLRWLIIAAVVWSAIAFWFTA